MQRNDLLRNDKGMVRVLDVREDSVCIIDCIKRTMPKWVSAAALSDYVSCSEEELYQETDMAVINIEMLNSESRKFVHEHFTLIAGILPCTSHSRTKHKVSNVAVVMGNPCFNL